MSFAQIEGGVIVNIVATVDPIADADQVMVDISSATPPPQVGWFATMSAEGVWEFSQSLPT
jgi:hypothetical protein